MWLRSEDDTGKGRDASGAITTTDSKHYTTLLPLVTIDGGNGIVFGDLLPIPNAEFIFPRFPNLPSMLRIHLHGIQILASIYQVIVQSYLHQTVLLTTGALVTAAPNNDPCGGYLECIRLLT